MYGGGPRGHEFHNLDWRLHGHYYHAFLFSQLYMVLEWKIILNTFLPCLWLFVSIGPKNVIIGHVVFKKDVKLLTNNAQWRRAIAKGHHSGDLQIGGDVLYGNWGRGCAIALVSTCFVNGNENFKMNNTVWMQFIYPAPKEKEVCRFTLVCISVCPNSTKIFQQLFIEDARNFYTLFVYACHTFGSIFAPIGCQFPVKCWLYIFTIERWYTCSRDYDAKT